MRVLSILAIAALTACGGGTIGPLDATLTVSGLPTTMPTIPTVPVTVVNPPVTPPKPVCTVTFYGDSILHGAWSPDNVIVNRLQRYPAAEVKAQRPKWTINDKTLSGQSLYALEPDFRNDYRNTRFVVIESGVIDSWANQAIKQRLTDMVNFVKAEGRSVIITGFAHQAVKTNPPFVYITPDMLHWRASNDAVARQVALETGSVFAAYGDAVFNGTADIVDSVHPTQEYSLRLTAQLIAALDLAAPECAGAAE